MIAQKPISDFRSTFFSFPSHTLRHWFTPQHAGVGSGARLQLPTNSFGMCEQTAHDSQLTNPSAATHAPQSHSDRFIAAH
jgi:hypothetical protein